MAHQPSPQDRGDAETRRTGDVRDDQTPGTDRTDDVRGRRDDVAPAGYRPGDRDLDRDDADGRDRGYRETRTPERVETREGTREPKPAKTSAAATFGLVFGLSALLSALTLLLTPLALVLGIIGLVLGIAGISMTKRVGVTGRGLAVAGIVLSVLGIVVSLVLIIGITTVLNNDQAVQRLQDQVQQLQNQLPDDLQPTDAG
ncbi:DUF4190 domain-containing protein [Pseudokineococcus basanitobsidens]|uniref:DUF4190 domain-containing protein n=1 Tax=Pseudokineococcus basanitobsidens TaxID=1926649 RepID=A0ABU8RLJ4_9ACTN